MQEVKSAQPYPSPILSIGTGIGTPQKFAFSPDFQNCPPPYFIGGIADMPMSGRRRTDRANLLQALGYVRVWFYHCHHTYSYSGGNNPTADMELVQAFAHISTYPHPGAVYQWNHDEENVHPRYYSEEKSTASVFAPQKYSEAEILSFEKEYAVKVPSFLRSVYEKGQELSDLWRDGNGNTYELQDILYLTDLADKPDALSAAAVIKLWPTLPVEKTPGKAPFFWGEDACGNLFLTCQDSDTVYFYDHEEDTYTPVYQA